MSEVREIREYTPDEYFHIIKERRQNITDADLQKIYDNCLELLNKYRITGQSKGARKLLFHLDCIEKEREIVAAGVDTFIYRDDIEEYIDHIAKDVVKIIELENYEREIPDEIVHVIEAVGGKFDKLYVLFTDYTGRVERRVEREKRSVDPILFGTFQDAKNRAVVDRFYYLGDWEDEHCDLTLDKLVGDVKTAKQRDITHTIKTPQDLAELKAQLGQLQPNPSIRDNGAIYIANTQASAPKTFFAKVRSIFTR